MFCVCKHLAKTRDEKKKNENEIKNDLVKYVHNKYLVDDYGYGFLFQPAYLKCKFFFGNSCKSREVNVALNTFILLVCYVVSIGLYIYFYGVHKKH